MLSRWTLIAATTLAVAAPAWGQTAGRIGQSSAADLERTTRQRRSVRGMEPESGAQQWIKQNVESVTFDETPFEDVIRWTRGRPGDMNVVVKWHVLEVLGVDRDAPVTLELKNVPLWKVLHFVLEQASPDVPLGYCGEENVLPITLQEELNAPRNFIIRAYPVTDLVRNFMNVHSAPSIRLSSLQQMTSGGGMASSVFTEGDGDEDDEPLGDRVQRVLQMLLNTVEPESWSENGGQGTAMAVRDVIIVNNSIEVHEKIGGAIRLPPDR